MIIVVVAAVVLLSVVVAAVVVVFGSLWLKAPVKQRWNWAVAVALGNVAVCNVTVAS